MVRHYFDRMLQKSGFDKLEQREKITILIGVGFLVCFVILQFGISPYLEADNSLDKSISKRRSDLIELQSLQQEFIRLKSQAGGIREQLKERPANFSLFSFLDSQASRAEIKEFISYMKPSTSEGDGDLQESVVEMKLQKISLEQLVKYLQLIESPENVVSIKRVSIQESGKEEGLLEVIMQIVTFMDIS